jgi:hypothetical protein
MGFKITIKTTETAPKKKELEEGQSKSLLRIMGRAKKASLKIDGYGESLVFAGAFEAIRISDGQVFIGDKLQLPASIEKLLGNQLEKAGPVDFAVELGIKYAKNPAGYDWLVNPLFNGAGPADELAHLRPYLSQGLDIQVNPVDTNIGATSKGTSKKDAKK